MPILQHVSRVASKTDVGARTVNQDAVFPDGHGDPHEPTEIVVVADGMGGAAGGEVASRIAVSSVVKRFIQGRRTGETLEGALRAAIREAHAAVAAEAARRPELTGMGTTVVALAIDPAADEGVVGHVGDSRAYVLHETDVIQLTRDHSRVQELVDVGHVAPDVVRGLQASNVITRALGLDDPEPEISARVGLRGSTFFLCTDGVHGVVPRTVIESALRHLPTDLIPPTLIELSLQVGTTDNCTIAVVRFGPEPAAALSAEFIAHASADVGRPVRVSGAAGRTPAPTLAKNDAAATNPTRPATVVGTRPRLKLVTVLVVAGILMSATLGVAISDCGRPHDGPDTGSREPALGGGRDEASVPPGGAPSTAAGSSEGVSAPDTHASTPGVTGSMVMPADAGGSPSVLPTRPVTADVSEQVMLEAADAASQPNTPADGSSGTELAEGSGPPDSAEGSALPAAVEHVAHEVVEGAPAGRGDVTITVEVPTVEPRSADFAAPSVQPPPPQIPGHPTDVHP